MAAEFDVVERGDVLHRHDKLQAQLLHLSSRAGAMRSFGNMRLCPLARRPPPTAHRSKIILLGIRRFARRQAFGQHISVQRNSHFFVPGHCETGPIKGALICSTVGLLVERTSRLLILARVHPAPAPLRYRRTFRPTQSRSIHYYEKR